MSMSDKLGWIAAAIAFSLLSGPVILGMIRLWRAKVEATIEVAWQGYWEDAPKGATTPAIICKHVECGGGLFRVVDAQMRCDKCGYVLDVYSGHWHHLVSLVGSVCATGSQRNYCYNSRFELKYHSIIFRPAASKTSEIIAHTNPS